MDEPTDITITTEQRGEACVLFPVGDIDLSRSPVLRASMKTALDDKPQRLVIELSGVSYMDSSGVATLVEAMQLSRKAGVGLVLCSLTERVQSIFEIARLEQVFTITEDLDGALAT
ncbi:MAG: STAS domain-containing protein [Planctomycetota bacterium]